MRQYDPDILVHNAESAKAVPYDGTRTSVQYTDGPMFRRALPTAGIPLAPVVDRFIESELKFKRTVPMTAAVPAFQSDAALLGPFLYGSLTDVDSDALADQLARFTAVKRTSLNLEAILSCISPTEFNARVLANYGLRRGRQIFALCLVRHDSAEDVRFIWNLRACGATVVPWPIDLLQSEAYRDDLIRVVRSVTGPNDHIWYTAPPGLAKHFPLFARTIRLARMGRAFTKKISHGLSLMADEAADLQLSQQRRTLSVDNSQEYVTTDSLSADVASPHARFVNVVQIHGDYTGWPTGAMSPGLSSIGKNDIFGGFYRVTSRGLAYLCLSTQSSISFPIPDSISIVRAYFKERNIEARVSDKGAMLNQFVLRMRGISWAAIVMNGWYVDALKDAKAETMITVDPSSENESPHRSVALQILAEHGLIALGVRVKCESCTRNQWFSLSMLKEIVLCPFCQSEIGLHIIDPSRLRWAYKARGALASRDTRSDLAASLLAARYLSERRVERDVTLAPAMELRHVDWQCEIDLIALVRENYAVNEPRPLFAECKSEARFEQRDFDRLLKLGTEFPNSFIVLATSRSRFKGGEKEKLRGLISALGPGRVIALTSEEMQVDAVMKGTAPQAYSFAELADEMHERHIAKFVFVRSEGQDTAELN